MVGVEPAAAAPEKHPRAAIGGVGRIGAQSYQKAPKAFRDLKSTHDLAGLSG
jgi:hypothetical protein